VDAGVEAVLVEPPLAAGLEVELELLLPHAVATITVAASVANPTKPLRAPLVMSLLL
jgi:hypothetical protein